MAFKGLKHVKSCSHYIYDLTFISEGGGEGGGVTGDKVGKLVTEVEGTVAAS